MDPTGYTISLGSTRGSRRGKAGRHGAARTVPPEDMTPTDLADLASAEVATNPAKAGGTGASYGGAYRVTYKTPAAHVFSGHL